MAATKYPPGPKERFPGEHLLALNRNPSDFLTRLASDYGDLSYFHIGPHRFFLLNHPDLIKEVLVTHHRDFIKGRGHEQMKRLLGEGIVTSEGDFHLRQRRIMQPAFNRRHLAGYDGEISELAAAACDRWQDGETVDITHEMWILALRIIARTMFATTLEGEAEEVREALGDLTRMFSPLTLLFMGVLERVPNPLWWRYARARARLDRAVYRTGDRRGDLFAALTAAGHEAGGEPLSEKQVRDEMLTIFIAGVGATADALSRTWYLIARHPEVAAQFYAEVDAVLGGRRPTAADGERMVYTRRVFSEALRLYPPTWVTDREPVHDYEMRGFCLPAGSVVIISPWVTHHDPRFFPDPFRCDPDRFIPERARGRPDFAYFPFGGGPRVCIGEPLAWLAAPLVLGTIAQKWQPRLSPLHPVHLVPHLNWDPKDRMFLRVERRAERRELSA